MKLCGDDLETDLMKQFNSTLPSSQLHPPLRGRKFVWVSEVGEKKQAKNRLFALKKVKATNIKQPETGMLLIYPPNSYNAFLFSSSERFHKDQTHSVISAELVVPPELPASSRFLR